MPSGRHIERWKGNALRLSELSSRSGVSVASIKYYLREGLLGPGTPVGPRQAEYGDEHLARLRVVRAMLKVGGMTVGQARDVLAAADDPAFGRHERLGIAQYMLPPHVTPPQDDPVWDAVHAEVRGLLAGLGWDIHAHAPALATLTRAVVTLRSLGHRMRPEDITGYAVALRAVAEVEYEVIEGYEVLEEAIEATVAYTLLCEPVLLSLRRLAHEDVSARLYKRAAGPAEDG